LVYDELRQLAGRKMAREKAGQTLGAAAVVHEAYLRLVGGPTARRDFENRGHFFAAAATAMRHILIDNARRNHAQKRGGELQRQPLDAVAAPEPDEDLLALDISLEKLGNSQNRWCFLGHFCA
jgi:RNA polymerase sigma factor (TIGR02999 family)